MYNNKNETKGSAVFSSITQQPEPVNSALPIDFHVPFIVTTRVGCDAQWRKVYFYDNRVSRSISHYNSTDRRIVIYLIYLLYMHVSPFSSRSAAGISGTNNILHTYDPPPPRLPFTLFH